MSGAVRVVLKDGRSAEIRPFEPRDAEALIEHVNAVGAERVHIMTERLARAPDEVVRDLRRYDGTGGRFLVAEVQGRLVGSGEVRRGEPSKQAHTAELGIAIHQGFRGLGLGEAMMRELIGRCTRAGLAKVGLDVFAANGPAIRPYRKLGFVEEGRMVGQVMLDGEPVDQLRMARFLP